VLSKVWCVNIVVNYYYFYYFRETFCYILVFQGKHHTATTECQQSREKFGDYYSVVKTNQQELDVITQQLCWASVVRSQKRRPPKEEQVYD